MYGYTLQDLVRDGRITAEEVASLREWARGQPGVPELPDEQLALFHLACERDAAATARCILAYHHVKALGPHLFDDQDVSRPELQHQLGMLEFCVLPARTADGACVVLHRLRDPGAGNYHMEPAMKLLFMTLDAALLDARGPPAGLVMLLDMRRVGLAHLARLRLPALRLFFRYLQEALPVALRRIHVLNAVWFFERCLALVRPLMNAELLARLHVHPPAATADAAAAAELLRLPRAALPADYGGQLPPVAELHRDNAARLAQLRAHFAAEQRRRQQRG